MTVDESLLDEIRALELRLLQPEVRSSPLELAELLAEEFFEFGSSGRRFDREQIVASLGGEAPFSSQLDDFRLTVLGEQCVLATYRLTTQSTKNIVKRTLRSSIWTRRHGRWRMIFHQGTLRAADSGE